MSTNSLLLPLRYRFVRIFSSQRQASVWLKNSLKKIFEHKDIHKILGPNLALAVVATSFLQGHYIENKAFVPGTATVVQSQTISFITEKGIQDPVMPVIINQKYSVFHPGVDLDGVTGDPVRPIMAGHVQSLQYSNFAYGNAIILDHGNGITSLYAHLSKILVKTGDSVTHNTIIGLVGSTGHSTGDHLHLEVRENNKPFDPLTVILH
jgi:murein DD-endopeptidase MepM/ murein hydrolase activator NlpD